MGESLARGTFRGSTEDLSVLGIHSEDFPDFRGSVKGLEAVTDYEYSYS